MTGVTPFTDGAVGRWGRLEVVYCHFLRFLDTTGNGLLTEAAVGNEAGAATGLVGSTCAGTGAVLLSGARDNLDVVVGKTNSGKDFT